jgi:hypothetical protein
MKSVRLIASLAFFVCACSSQGSTEEVDAPAEAELSFSPVPSNLASLPKDLEVRLALSALPAHLRAGATVWTLNLAKGYEIEQRGTNGFHTFVARNDFNAYRSGMWDIGEYKDDFLIPMAWDAEGFRSIVPFWFDGARMQASGVPQRLAKRVMNERLKKGYYRAPSRAGISYMLAPILRAYANPKADSTVFVASMPHHMFYAPHVTNEDIGGDTAAGPMILDPADPHTVILSMLGSMERAAIVTENADLLRELCAIRSTYCVTMEGMTHE